MDHQEWDDRGKPEKAKLTRALERGGRPATGAVKQTENPTVWAGPRRRKDVSGYPFSSRRAESAYEGQGEFLKKKGG